MQKWESPQADSRFNNTELTPTSILVSAPTSSGKTFISFYLMEKILREASKSEGIVVYVSPTKALVNQVEADLYARFDKSYTKGDKARTMHGVFLKEFRFNVDECQILITVPECLEILLFEAMHQKWADRLRWVIFDEIHCISKENGAVWERLLIATHCPWVALSATIGNPDEFGGWLKQVEAGANVLSPASLLAPGGLACASLLAPGVCPPRFKCGGGAPTPGGAPPRGVRPILACAQLFL
jgi:superfamily II RNA helicase